MLKFNSIMIGTSNLKVLGEFYGKVFARPSDMQDVGGYSWQDGSTYLNLLEHSEVKGQSKEPARILFNFETENVKEEFERLHGLGATVIQEPYEMQGMRIATLADPDGNYFQLMSPWKNEES